VREPWLLSLADAAVAATGLCSAGTWLIRAIVRAPYTPPNYIHLHIYVGGG